MKGRRDFHTIFASASLGIALLAFSSLPCPVRAEANSNNSNSSMRREAASAQFARAEEMRAALNAKDWDKRTLVDYKRAVTSYQRVYLITPHAVEVPDAILAVAELNTEMGDRFGRTYYQAAVEAYQYLIHEYPTSKYVQDSQLRLAKLQKDQLGDIAAATKSYQDFQKNYPRSPRKREVQEALAELALQRNAETTGAVVPAKAAPAANNPPGTASPAPPATTNSPAASPVSAAVRNEAPTAVDSKSITTGGEDAPSGAVPRVQRIRTSVTPDSTEVVIDLEDSVQYVSGRITNPDRIYFDLYAARLSPGLVRDQVKIEGDRLSAVRVAQNKAGIVRVVLEVHGVKDYAASLMKRPARLIIELYSTPAKSDPTQTAHTNRTSKPVIKPTPGDSAIAVASAVTDPTPEEVIEVPPAATPTSAPATKPASTVSSSTTRTDTAATMPKAAPVTNSAAPANTTSNTSSSANALPPASTVSNLPSPKAELPLAKRTKASNSPTSVTNAITKPELVRPSPSAVPLRDGQSTLTRALGLKIGRIVIDAGHGGHDTGTIGPTGLMEKDLCLDVALRVGKLIEQKMPGAEIVYTRSDDTFVPLEERTRIANDAKADLFLSIHANSSPDHGARGVETYYLNMRGSADAMEVAARENASSQQGIHDLEDLVKKIARTEKIDESKEFASDIQDSLSKRIQKTAKPVKNRGVRKAPFVVLIGADMPSILTEISFLSNPADEQLLKKPEHRQRVAEGLVQGVSDYLQSLNSMNVDRPRTVRPTVVNTVEQSRAQK